MQHNPLGRRNGASEHWAAGHSFCLLLCCGLQCGCPWVLMYMLYMADDTWCVVTGAYN